MTQKKNCPTGLVNIRCTIFLLFFISLIFLRIAKGQSSCPFKCQCYISIDPRKIICSNQELENYPSNISDLVQHLDLSNNFIETISDDVKNLVELEYLNLAQNRLKSLPEDLRDLVRLEKLDLSDNGITTIGEIDSIRQLTSLKVLYLSKNPLTEIDSLRNIALRALDVSKCSITNINSTSLRGLPELVTLSLEGNPLKSIQRLTSEKLRWLDLSDCCLNYLKPDTFEGAPDLEQIRLSNNPTLVFSSRNETLRHNNLKRLDVSSCNLDRPGLHGFPALTQAILSKNLIRILPDRIFAKNRQIEQLYLNGNGLSVVNRSSFAGLVKLETLDLSSNSLTHFHPFTFRETISLQVLNISFNDFEKLPNFVSTVTTLDVSYNFIEKVPKYFFNSLPRLRTLDLSDNRLEGSSDQFQCDTLKNLMLRRNRLVELANDSFSDLPELQKLDLSGNRLTEAMNLEIFASNENLRTIALEDNPWRCDCAQLYRTFLYLTEFPGKTKASSLVCQSPSNVSGFSWQVACYRDWNENQDIQKDRTWGIIMLSLLISVVVFGTTISVRHTFMIKRQARLERARLEREEGIERLRLLRRRNMELEAAANERSNSEPRIHPLELINPPPYEEAVQMPRMAQSLDALDSITAAPIARQTMGSVDSLRGRKRRSRRPRSRVRTEENVSRRDARRNRSGSRGNFSPSLTSIASRTIHETQRSNDETNEARNSTIVPKRDTESEERSSDSKRRPRSHTSINKTKRRRQVSKNGHSTDDEDSDIADRKKGQNDVDKPIVIQELLQEPRSGYRPNSQVNIV